MISIDHVPSRTIMRGFAGASALDSEAGSCASLLSTPCFLHSLRGKIHAVRDIAEASVVHSVFAEASVLSFVFECPQFHQ